jgi:F-type H+-transporting ATPase subunit b
MPQLDIASFLPQLFWLAVTFLVLYLLMAKVALPQVGAVIDARSAKIDGDLAAAEQARQGTERLIAAHDQAMRQAYVEAQRLVKLATDSVAAEAARRDAELKLVLDKEAEQAEFRIAEARHSALAQLLGMSADAAAAAVGRLGGIAVTPDQANAAVESAARDHSQPERV